MRFLIIILTLLVSTTIAAQNYSAGFKVLSTTDSSRCYKPNTAPMHKLHYRPVAIDLWYPANIKPSDTTMSFGDLVQLLEQRSNDYDDTRSYHGLTDELLQYICAATNCPNYKEIKNLKTRSYVNAVPVKQPFPLVVYFTGFNGMSYENYLLFESLAKNGFIVASISSIGRYPGNMTMDAEDVFEQIKDAEVAVALLTKNNLVTDNIGLVGYSWGGLAATLMAMNNPPGIKAIVSLDGSEQFNYGDAEENKKLNAIREADFFKPKSMHTPFLYLDNDISLADDSPDSVYNIADFIGGEKEYLKIQHATHDDFSCMSVLLNKARDTSRYNVIQQLTISYLLQKLKNELSFDNMPMQGVTRQFSQPVSKDGNNIKGERILNGYISEAKSHRPLPYVNVGVLNKERGTTSDALGNFSLSISESNINDTLRFSMVGYEPKLVCLRDILQKHKPNLNIQLLEKTNELKEIVITEKSLTTRTLGNKTQSKFFGGKFASGDLGSEIAIKIKIKKSPTYLDAFNFNISYNTGDTAAFRINIYDIRNGLPHNNILSENIITRINGQRGMINIDMTKYDVVLTDDVFIALEWIEGKRNSGIVFSAGFVNKGTYYRKTSQGKWRKYPMGVGFNVTVKTEQ